MATTTAESLAQREKLENQYDTTVRKEIETFRAKALSHLAGEITDKDFRPYRLKHGIYGQRQPGVQMVRCKIPGGLLTTAQTNALARIADEFGGGRGHLTTRQNIQYHFVPLNRVADLMTVLADVGLTNRGETAGDRIWEACRHQFVTDFGGTRCYVVETVVTHRRLLLAANSRDGCPSDFD